MGSLRSLRPSAVSAVLAAALAAAACNPNVEFGPDAPDAPPPAPAGQTHGDGGGGHGGEGGDPHGGGARSGMPSLDRITDALKARLSDPKDYEARLQLGQLFAEQGKWDEAEKMLGEAAALEPKKAEARVLRANVMLQKRAPEEAKKELDAADAIAPDDQGVLRAWSGYYLLVEDVQKAIAVRKKLLAKYPDIEDAENIELWNFYLARIPKLKADDKAKEFFDYVGAGSRASDAGKHDEAIAAFEKARAIMADDPHLLSSLAAAQHASGKKAEGIATWKAALALDPLSSKTRLGYARALAGDGDVKGAIATLKEWKKLDARRAKRHDTEEILARLEKGEPFDAGKATMTAAAGGTNPHGDGGGRGSGQHMAMSGEVPLDAGSEDPGAITGTIEIAPAIAKRIPPDATLFVFGKQQRGPGAPLVVKRVALPAFPAKFALSKADVMQQGMPFEGAVYLTARIDTDGMAGATPGDLQVESTSPILSGTRNVKLVIDTVVGEKGGAPSVAAGAATPAPQSTAAASGGTAGAIRGTITVSPNLASKVKQGATLFIFAKQQPGAGPPLAVKRTTVSTFPLTFELTKDNVMQPGMPFDGDVYLTARIDGDGIAGAGPGDLEGVTTKPVAVGTGNVALTIDTVR